MMGVKNRLQNEYKADNSKGFTLAELLVVVAIIGVLVAVSIPIFASQLEKAKLATCQANRRSLLAEVRVKALYSDMDQNKAFCELYSKADYPCPGGGTFSLENGQIICSVHDKTGGTSSYSISAGGIKITNITDIGKEFKQGDRASFSENKIYQVGSDFYIFQDSLTNVEVTGEYSTWFSKNVSSYTAAKINLDSITTSIANNPRLSAGSLYVDGNKVYVMVKTGYPLKAPANHVFFGQVGE